MTPRLIIFCDGGIGNRINALISGLAIARYFELPYQIHWPINNWCAAAFEDIFESRESISILSIKDLHGQMGDALPLLHDDIAAQSLGIAFGSAYAYSSMEDFSAKALALDQTMFYYPALMPTWVPAPLIHAALRSLQFSAHIQTRATQFITQTLQSPFHGLHLRRTDLQVGFTDHEVLTLVKQYPQSVFFVCSDDPLAEALASAHPNVHRRVKTQHVEKQSSLADWLAPTEDDDGRLYHGNIQRSKDAVIEGAIDLLILSHSQIIGFSGSTFQSLARMIGEVCPLVSLDKPAPLPAYSSAEMKRQIQARLLSSELLIQLCNVMASQANFSQAIELLQFAIEHFEEQALNDLFHTLSIFYLNQSQPKKASIYLEQALALDPVRYASWLHLSYARALSKNYSDAKEAFNRAQQCKRHALSESETYLDDWLEKQLSMQ
jgi:tetratricopeptide (TPR) repeat protein